MMKEGLIGVIVPVYKVEKYVAECIESILAQTYTNFRLILVDDGTPDNAGKICDEHAKKDSRITVIHQENAGVTRARARGVEEATDCEWIMFVDSDDMLKNTALRKFHDKTDCSTDVIINTCYYLNDKELYYYDSYKNKEYIDTEFFIRRNIHLDGGEPWGKLYRKSLFDKYTFDIPKSITCGEDVLMNIRLALKSNKKIKTIYTPEYFHRVHNESVFYNFKHTPEYEELFGVHLLKSIPKDLIAKFMDDYIEIRIKLWRNNGGNNLKTPMWANTPFHKQLSSDIKKYNYKLPYFECQLLTHTSQPLRAMIFLCRKVYSLFRQIARA